MGYFDKSGKLIIDNPQWKKSPPKIRKRTSHSPKSQYVGFAWIKQFVIIERQGKRTDVGKGYIAHYYENGKHVEDAKFDNIHDLNIYLWEVGGNNFIANNEYTENVKWSL